jgi:hypothetical protein
MCNDLRRRCITEENESHAKVLKLKAFLPQIKVKKGKDIPVTGRGGP